MAIDLEPVIGLEIHAQLATESKIFCGCSTRFGSAPNTNVCPVCLGLPGALPVLNGRAVDAAIKAALALGCQVHPTSIFARKNYFYPDLPKGYQISQYERPLATEGRVEYLLDGQRLSAGIIRVHMEEDAGKLLHEGFPDSDTRSYVDLNRSGVPLIEIVTRPDLRSAAQAAAFFEQLREILVWLGVNDGNMEEGSLRCDANVSVRPIEWAGTDRLGTKAEIKNVNSFRFLQKAIDYEIGRQHDLLARGERVRQETRLFDPATGRTASMRSKEEAHDYRYFPDPDLPRVEVSPARIGRMSAELPELPAARRARLVSQYALPEYDAGVLVQSAALADYFEATAARSGNPKAASNWIMRELLRKMREEGRDIASVPMTPEALAGLIALVEKGTISGTTGKAVFEKMYGTSRSAQEIVDAEELTQIDDEEKILGLVRQVCAEQAGPVAQFRAGKTGTLGFLVGQVMKATGGKANPKLVNELFRRVLDQG